MAKKSPKINVYTLGQHGINRVKSPVHVLDGELLNAQNATVRPIHGQLAITKRDGMAKINADAAAGTLLAIKNIPIDDPDVLERLYLGRWGERDIIATNGYTIAQPVPLGPVLDLHNRYGLCQGHEGKLYIVTSGATLHVWDGSTYETVADTPVGDQINSMWFDEPNQRLYCGFEGSNVTAKVAYYDGANWTTMSTTNLGGQNHTGYVCVLDDGSVFTYAHVDGLVKLYDPDTDAWLDDADTTIDFGFPANSRHIIQQLYSDGTNVYAVFQNRTIGATPEKFIFKRASDGTWSNISPTTLSREYGTVTNVCMWDNVLHASYHDEAGTVIEIWKRVGSTWSVDLDILADEPGTAWTLTSRLVQWRDRIWASPDTGVEDYLLYKASLEGSWQQFAIADDAGSAMAPGVGF